MTADIAQGWLDPATVLPIREAADLCEVTIRSLERDHADATKAFQLIKRGRQNFVSVQSLIDAGRYTPGQVGRAINTEVEQLRVKVAELLAANSELRDELEELQALHAESKAQFRQLVKCAPVLRGVA